MQVVAEAREKGGSAGRELLLEYSLSDVLLLHPTAAFGEVRAGVGQEAGQELKDICCQTRRQAARLSMCGAHGSGEGHFAEPASTRTRCTCSPCDGWLPIAAMQKLAPFIRLPNRQPLPDRPLVDRPALAGWPNSDCYQACVPDRLHVMKKGVEHYLAGKAGKKDPTLLSELLVKQFPDGGAPKAAAIRTFNQELLVGHCCSPAIHPAARLPATRPLVGTLPCLCAASLPACSLAHHTPNHGLPACTSICPPAHQLIPLSACLPPPFLLGTCETLTHPPPPPRLAGSAALP